MPEAAKRVARQKWLITLTPPVLSALIAISTLMISGAVHGYTPDAGAILFFTAMSAAALCPLLVAGALLRRRSAVCELTWLAVGGGVPGLSFVALTGSVDLTSDAQIGLVLLFGPIWAGVATVIGGALGWAASGLRFLQFTTRAEREAARLCGKCGYSLAGLTAPRCPECGAAC